MSRLLAIQEVYPEWASFLDESRNVSERNFFTSAKRSSSLKMKYFGTWDLVRTTQEPLSLTMSKITGNHRFSSCWDMPVWQASAWMRSSMTTLTFLRDCPQPPNTVV